MRIKKSDIFPHKKAGGFIININPIISGSTKFFEAQYLYFTSDEEPKEGDWIIWKGELLKAKKQHCYVARKIVATTDKSLFVWKQCNDCSKIGTHMGCNLCKKVNLAQISQQFIEEYVKAGGIDEVYLEYEKQCECKLLSDCYNPKLLACDKKYRLKTDQNNCVITSLVELKLFTLEEVSQKISNFGKDFAYKNGLQIVPSLEYTINWIKNNL